MSTLPEVHVGDIDTIYYIPLYDGDIDLVNFDPSSAVTRKMRFQIPGVATILERDADAVQVTISGTLIWCLKYQVTATDVNTHGFHGVPGKVKIQGKLTFASGAIFSTNVVTKDFVGSDLRVFKNLGA